MLIEFGKLNDQTIFSHIYSIDVVQEQLGIGSRGRAVSCARSQMLAQNLGDKLLDFVGGNSIELGRLLRLTLHQWR